MPKIAYTTINIQSWKLAIIQQVNTIVAEYKAHGFNLTLPPLETGTPVSAVVGLPESAMESRL
jgi:hypothetical protein